MALPAPLDRLGPVLVAPMAGGPSTPRLVAGAARAGAFAQLAGGYLAPEALARQIAAVRAEGARAFGVNLFVPQPHPISRAAYDAYAARIADDARAATDAAPPPLREDDDAWDDKLALVVAEQVPVVSCTFGLPDPHDLGLLRGAGIAVLQTVTGVDEAIVAEAAGVDALVVQGAAAGGHSGVWAQGALPPAVPLGELVAEVRAATRLPIVAAGGVVRREQVRALLAAGAEAVQVGTAVLLADEAGTAAAHRAALVDPSFDRTALTRAFTGRPARALVNGFVARHDAAAPSGYPALHHLTRPMRQAAAAAGDLERLHLWAGEGWRESRAAPVAAILAALAPDGDEPGARD
ncbi:nitronate monooxygenase [Agrococcus sp. SL85]|uniref:nitronate monooxygenase n=1 Tax=Agrococcus sp. SL85 TaxID=2995141 RepID=UPI00226D3180|nr:nitronate monooxygenase [Agrococcus sp. SL85]WAC66024.1 nitronate monooxygenase [Agrococcus sp. SL85]